MTGPFKILASLSLAAVLATVGPLPAQAQSSTSPTAQRQSAMPLFAVVYRPGPNWKVGSPMKDQNLRDHFFYLRDLSQENCVMVAGPLGENGGLVILRAPDQEAASKLISADPAVLADVFVGEVKPFSPRIGAMSRSLTRVR